MNPACRQRPRTVEVMAGCRIQCAWDSFSRREHRCRSGLHRPDCGGSTPPSRSRSLQMAARVANFDSEVPALNRRKLGTIPRRPTILPMWLSSDRCLRTATALPREAHWRHASALYTGSISASVVKLLSSSASNGEFAGGNPAGCTRFIGALAQQKRLPAQDGKVEGANPSRATNLPT